MRCVNCGFPLPPERNLTNCPRCGTSLNVFQGVPQQQFEQAGWGNMGGAPQQNPWGQVATPPPYNQYPQQNQSGPNMQGMPGFNGGMGAGMQQSPLSPRRPTPAPKKKPRTLFLVAGLCFVLSVLILGFVAVLGLASGGKPTPQAANTGAPTAAAASPTQASASPTTSNANASPTASASPSATGTAYPGQQYISGAQMVASDPSTTPQQQPTTTFTVGSKMYVTFNLTPPSQGGAVCSYWYLNGKQILPYPLPVKGTKHSSYLYATYGSSGPAYVELFWASDATCSDQVLAQHVDFTVTAN